MVEQLKLEASVERIKVKTNSIIWAENSVYCLIKLTEIKTICCLLLPDYLLSCLYKDSFGLQP